MLVTQAQLYWSNAGVVVVALDWLPRPEQRHAAKCILADLSVVQARLNSVSQHSNYPRLPIVDAVETVLSWVEAYSQQDLESLVHSARLQLLHSVVQPTSWEVPGLLAAGTGFVQLDHILAVARTFVPARLCGHVVVDNSQTWCWVMAAYRIGRLAVVVSAAVSNWAVLLDLGPL